MHVEIGATSRPSSEPQLIAVECWQALEHLRNALDLAPPHSTDSEALIAIMKRLANYAESTLAVPSRRNQLNR